MSDPLPRHYAAALPYVVAARQIRRQHATGPWHPQLHRLLSEYATERLWHPRVRDEIIEAFRES